jgi:CDP-diacylglycerol--glycerol-3-phosphate 3-phosphatidyltransferase
MPGLYALKGWFTALLSPVVKLAVGSRLSPNFFTVLGVIGGAFAGFGIATVHTWWVFVGVVVRLAGANLDGAVARSRGKESKHGFAINELGDRLADWAIFTGACFMPAAPSLSVWVSVMVAVALPTAVSLWGVRRGLPRINGGPFGKTERCLFVLVFIGLVQFGHIDAITQGYLWQVLIWASLVTALIRWQRIGAKR